MTRRTPAREWILVGAIVILAAAMRLPGLLSDGLWRDEANIYVQVTAPTFTEFFTRVMATEWHPPLYFLLMYGWTRIAGTGELALTIVPYFFSCATTVVVYLLGKTVAGIRVGGIAAAAFAVAPFAIAYSDEYLYPLMLFACTLLALVALRARDRPVGAISWLTLAATTLLVVGTHYTGLLYVPLLLVWIVVTSASKRRMIALSTAIVAGAMPFIVWIPVFLEQRKIGVPYSAIATLSDRLIFFARVMLEGAPVAPLIPAAIVMAVVLCALYSALRAHRLERDPLALGFVFPVVVGVLATFNLLADRYAFASFGLFCVFLGWIVAGIIDHAPRSDWGAGAGLIRRIAIACGVIVLALDVAGTLARSDVPKSGFRSMVFSRTESADTLYLIAPDYLASTFAFYARQAGTRSAGFVRWDHPEIFRLRAYATDWNRSDAVARTVAAIARPGVGNAYVNVIVDDRARNVGQLPYGNVTLLLSDLRARYRLVSRTSYPGRLESISAYRFALSHP